MKRLGGSHSPRHGALGALLTLALVLGAAPTPASAQASIHARSDTPGLTLHRMVGTHSAPVMIGNTVGVGTFADFEILCTLPCTATVPGGAVTFGVSRGAGNPIRAGAPVHVSGGLSLDVHYLDRSGLRIAGILTWIGATVLGAALAIGGLFTGPTRCTSTGRTCYQELDPAMIGIGAGVIVVGMAVGIPLTFWGDGASVAVARREVGGARAGEERDDPLPSLPREWSDEAIRRLLRDTHADILACLADGRDEVHVEVTLGTAGRVAAARAIEDVSSDEGQCFQRVLSAAQVRGAAARPRTVTLRYARATPSDETEPASADAGPPPDERVADEVRALLTARRAAVLACVESDAVAVRASWTASGELTIALRGERAGSAEEACIAAIFADERLEPAPGAAGELLHAISAE